ESLFQGEGNFSLARNLLFNPDGSAVAIQPHNDRPRRVSVAENFVAATGAGIVLRGGDPDLVQEIARNEVYAAAPLRGGTPVNNTVGEFEQASRALPRWLARTGARNPDRAMDRSRLALLARRT